MSDLTRTVTELITRVVAVDQGRLEAHTRFVEIDGWSSVAALALMVEVEEEWPLKLDMRQFMAVQTIGELVELVGAGLNSDPGGI